jgi:FtsZ-binding cell division protein ZapB
MFFNRNKITERAPKGKCSYEFTDKFCRNLNPEDYEGNKTISDKLCRNLRLVISSYTNHSYIYKAQGVCKVIGNVYQISIKDARKIAQNINENKEEFKKEAPKIKIPLYAYFQKFGEYPHQTKGTEVIISEENISLKEKIKDLQTENESLKAEIKKLSEENRKYLSSLVTIKKIVGEIYEDNTEVTD